MKQSAGILLYRFERQELQVLLAHPGGPFWARKDAGAWTIPKGEADEGEDLLAAAQREFAEETGQEVMGTFMALTPLKQKGGKVVHCWALEGNLDPTQLRSNTFELEWPPRSGKKKTFPEIDRIEWFNLEAAQLKLLPGQAGFLEELRTKLQED